MANSKIKLAIKSLNFKFLEEQLPELAILADSAEQYIFSNTNKAVGLLRSFAERIVNIIYSCNMQSFTSSKFEFVEYVIMLIYVNPCSILQRGLFNYIAA